MIGILNYMKIILVIMLKKLRKKEGEIIREIGTLNRCVVGRTQKEGKKNWRNNNKEYYHQYTVDYSKKYNEEHKEQRLA